MSSVLVIGAGPQGLAAAVHLLERGLEPLVVEAGDRPAAAVAEWGHVRLFSPWPELIDAASRRLLERHGWAAPESGFPTGDQWRSEYLEPLAAHLGDRVITGARVLGVSRSGRDLTVDAGRSEVPFVARIVHRDGREVRLEADAVIDASGTWGSPNPAGADGLPAPGEAEACSAGVVRSAIPRPEEVSDWAGQHVVVVGTGHSAATAIVELAESAIRTPGMQITWVMRRASTDRAFGGGSADELPERGALGQRAKRAVDAGLVTLESGFRIARIDLEGGRAVMQATDGRVLAPADTVRVLTGFRPDLSFLSEVRLDLDPRLQAPRRLAAEIDPNVHSCGSVRATGAADLAQPDPGFFIVGAKSYGRAPTFLALTGFEQVRSVAAHLAGDAAAAARVELVLPDTGVCGGAGLYDEPEAAPGGGCCSAAPKSPQRVPAPSPA